VFYRSLLKALIILIADSPVIFVDARILWINTPDDFLRYHYVRRKPELGSASPRHMKREEQNPVFEIWLAAYNSRLVQVAQSKAPTPNPPADESNSPSDPPAEEDS
jgi:hypothetical protein